MLFMDEHVRAILPALLARRPHCDAMIGCLSACEVVKTTRLNRFDMDGTQARRPRLPEEAARQARRPGQRRPPDGDDPEAAEDPALHPRLGPGRAGLLPHPAILALGLGREHRQPRALPRRPLRRRPARGLARDRRRAAHRSSYPETGLYHPRMAGRIGEDARESCRRPPAPARAASACSSCAPTCSPGTPRITTASSPPSEARGLAVVPAFASGLDNRPAVDAFFRRDGAPDHRRRWSRSPASPWSAAPPTTTRAAAEDAARRARRALPRRPRPRVPDPRAMGGLRPRPLAGGGHHDGGDPRARRRHRADGVRRPLQPLARRQRPRHARATPSAPTCSPPASSASCPCAARRGPSAGSPSCCSASRPMPAASAPPPSCRSTSRSTTP